jgi:hypothetical protein
MFRQRALMSRGPAKMLMLLNLALMSPAVPAAAPAELLRFATSYGDHMVRAPGAPCLYPPGPGPARGANNRERWTLDT